MFATMVLMLEKGAVRLILAGGIVFPVLWLGGAPAKAPISAHSLASRPEKGSSARRLLPE